MQTKINRWEKVHPQKVFYYKTLKCKKAPILLCCFLICVILTFLPRRTLFSFPCGILGCFKPRVPETNSPKLWTHGWLSWQSPLQSSCRLSFRQPWLWPASYRLNRNKHNNKIVGNAEYLMLISIIWKLSKWLAVKGKSVKLICFMIFTHARESCKAPLAHSDIVADFTRWHVQTSALGIHMWHQN